MKKSKKEVEYIKESLQFPIIGIDESYTRTGIAVVDNKKIIKVGSINFNKHKAKNKSEKREIVNTVLNKLINEYNPKLIIVEKIRMFSQGFISKGYIASTGALIATIVDVAYKYDIPVYSVDTRSWKSKVVGTSKHKQKNKKVETINFVKNNLGINVGNNDDAADAVCIALYPYEQGAILHRET